MGAVRAGGGTLRSGIGFVRAGTGKNRAIEILTNPGELATVLARARRRRGIRMYIRKRRHSTIPLMRASRQTLFHAARRISVPSASWTQASRRSSSAKLANAQRCGVTTLQRNAAMPKLRPGTPQPPPAQSPRTPSSRWANSTHPCETVCPRNAPTPRRRDPAPRVESALAQP